MTGSEIRAARHSRGWTQAQLAKKVERSQPFISMVERGRGGTILELKKIAGVLGLSLGEPRPEPRSAALPSWGPPAVPELPLPIAVRTWQRPLPSGDGLVVVPAGHSGILVAAFDVVGGSQLSVAASLYLKGWLRGWMAASERAPRIETIAEHLDRALRQAGIEAAYFLGLFQSGGPDRPVMFETVRRGFPPPLLVTGLPAQPRDLRVSAEEGPGQAERTEAMSIPPPWRLLLSSDGLLRRIGAGSELEGRRTLVRWNEGPTRDQQLEDRLSTSEPTRDDESCFVIDWTGWSRTRHFDVADEAERHRVCRELSSLVETALGEPARAAAEAVLIEALQNVRRHAYSGGGGAVYARLRQSDRSAQIEIEDEGRGGEILEGDGVKIMKHRTAALDFRRRYPHGTIVLAEFRGQPATK